MTNEELLAECKKGLNIPAASTAFDSILNQKLFAVKGFLSGAGVSGTMMASELAVGVIVMGVGDLWELKAGEVKFSPAFYSLATQLTASSSKLNVVSSSPADGDTDVAVDAALTITFDRRITSYKARLVETATSDEIGFTSSLDISDTILTITPNANLDASTEYGIILTGVIASTGVSISFQLIRFTTA